MSNNFYFIVSVILFSILCSSNSVAQQLNVINDERPDKTISQYSVSDSLNYAANAIDLSSYNTIDPTMTWGHTQEWKNPQVNFLPSHSLIQAGDLNGDGYEDFIANYNSWDERTDDLSDRVNKTLVYFGPDNLTDPDWIFYKRLVPIGDILGRGSTQLVSIEDDRMEIYRDIREISYGVSYESVSQYGGWLRYIGQPSLKMLFEDIDNDQSDDFIGYNYQTIVVGLVDRYFAPFHIYEFDLNNYIEENNFMISDLHYVEWDERNYLIALLQDNVGNGRPQELAVFLVDSNRLELIQRLNFSENLARSIRLHLLEGSDGFPNILASGYDYSVNGSSEGRFSRLLVKSDGPDLYKASKYLSRDENVTLSISTIGDLNGNGWSDMLYSTNDELRYAIFNPADTTISLQQTPVSNGSLSEGSISVGERLNSFKPQGDLNNDGFDDFQYRVSNENAFGHLQVIGVGDQSSVDYQSPDEFLYDAADYRVKQIESTYVFSDLTGNGLDDYGMYIIDGVNNRLEIFEGGSLGNNAIMSIEIEDELTFATSGDFESDGREDLLLLTRSVNNLEDGYQINANVEMFKFGEITPYRTIDDQDYNPDLGQINNTTYLVNAANAGDINHDGLDDILLSAPGNSSQNPIGIYLGGQNSVTPDLTIAFPEGDGISYQWGWGGTLQGGFDFNGDGIDDFIIGNVHENNTNLLEDNATYPKIGAVHIYYGQSGSPDFSDGADVRLTSDSDAFESNILYQLFGFNEIAYGDFNGDGSTDLAIKPYLHRDQNDSREGRAGIHIFHGGEDFDGEPDQLIPLFRELHQPMYMGFGNDTTSQSGRIYMSAVPDVNEDGADELLVIQHNGALFFGGERLSDIPDVVLVAPNSTLGFNEYPAFINRQLRLAIGEISRDGVTSVLLSQPGDTNYRDTPAYLYELTNLAVSNEEVASDLPETYSLDQNYPNPFNPSTQIQFSIPQASDVRLTVYNVLGQQVKTLVDEFMQAGSHTARFDARNLSSGMYIYRLEAGSVQLDGKMMLIK
jgi:hypothetical protein